MDVPTSGSGIAINGVQFQPFLMMTEFVQRDGSDELCDAAVVESRWSQGFLCPD